MPIILKSALISNLYFISQVSLCVKRLFYTNDQREIDKGVCSNFLCDLKPRADVKITGPVGKEMLMPKDTIIVTIIMVRKRDIILKFSWMQGASASSVCVKVKQIKNSFQFGSCISRSNIENEEFVNFFLKNFNWAVFGNELKWCSTDPEQGKYNYRDADEMKDFYIRYGIEARGHCIFWEVEDVVQPWV